MTAARTADNVDDEDEGALSVLDDDDQRQRRGGAAAVFEDLGEDQLAEVIAFCWVGQGTYEAGDWDEAMEEAQSLSATARDGAIDELMDSRCWPRCSKPGSPRSTSAATGSATSASAAER